MLLTLIKGRYAAFFLSLQSINIVAGNTPLQVFNLSNFVFHFTTRGTDSHDVILLFADQTTGDRRVHGDQILLKISFIITHDAVGLFLIGIEVEHADG